MEEESSTPSDLLINLQKLAQERTRIKDKISTSVSPSQPVDETPLPPNPFDDHEQIEQDQEQAGKRGEIPVIEPEPPMPTDRRLLPPDPFNTLKQADSSSARSTVVDPPRPANETLLVAPSRGSLTGKSGKNRYLVIGSGALICLLLLSGTGIFWLLQQLQRTSIAPSQPIATVRPAAAQKTVLIPTPTTRVVPIATPTKKATPVASAAATISFEDGSASGWYSSSQDGTIQSIENVSTNRAQDGKHALMISFDSDDDHSYPCVGTSNLPAPLKAGQTITAYILKREGSRVKADLYVADQAGKWYSSSAYTLVDSTNIWYPVTFRLPSNLKGSVAQVGFILFGDNVVVYIDNINWH